MSGQLFRKWCHDGPGISAEAPAISAEATATWAEAFGVGVGQGDPQAKISFETFLGAVVSRSPDAIPM